MVLLPFRPLFTAAAYVLQVRSSLNCLLTTLLPLFNRGVPNRFFTLLLMLLLKLPFLLPLALLLKFPFASALSSARFNASQLHLLLVLPLQLLPDMALDLGCLGEPATVRSGRHPSTTVSGAPRTDSRLQCHAETPQPWPAHQAALPCICFHTHSR